MVKRRGSMNPRGVIEILEERKDPLEIEHSRDKARMVNNCGSNEFVG